MLFKCPGADRFRHPQPQIIKCSICSEELEIWTDEIKTVCPKCKNIVIRKEDTSCLDWCRYAKYCVGEKFYTEYMRSKASMMKQKLLKELEDYFQEDIRRINHAKNVMHFAEELLKREKADWHIVIPASILHDIGIKEAEKKYSSNQAHLHEKEGAVLARKILIKLGFKIEDIEQICQIITYHHSPGRINTENFKLLYDADRLVNLREEVDIKDKVRLKEIIGKVFLTPSGRELAQRIYLKTEK